MRESAELGYSHKVHLCSDRVSRIDELVNAHGDIDLPYPQTAGLSLLANIPEHVADDWRAACFEIQEVMATHGWVL